MTCFEQFVRDRIVNHADDVFFLVGKSYADSTVRNAMNDFCFSSG